MKTKQIRRYTQAAGFAVLRFAAYFSIIFLLLFIVLLFSKGGAVFFKYRIHEKTVTDLTVKNMVINNAVVLNNTPYSILINEGTIIEGTVHQGSVIDADIEEDEDYAENTAISRLTIHKLSVERARLLDYSADFVFSSEYKNTWREPDTSGSYAHIADITAVKPELYRGFNYRPREYRNFVQENDKEICITHTNIAFEGGEISYTTVYEGTLIDVPLSLCVKRPSLYFITSVPQEGMTGGGIYPAILGTGYMTLLAILFAFPIGVLAAIFLNEYAYPPLLVKIIRIAINTLAGVPSIVYGLFGMVVFVNYFNLSISILSGSLTLAILILPIIINAAEEALKVVPLEYREAALGLGASKRQMIWTVVLPAGLPNILTGAIIAVGRAAGETAPILFTAAAFYLIGNPSLLKPCMALPYHIYALMTEGTADVQTTIAYGTAIVLLALVLVINGTAIIIRYRIRKKRNL